MIKHFGWKSQDARGRLAVILPDEHVDAIGFRRISGQAPSVGLLRHIVAAMDPDGSFFAKGIALCKARVQPFAVERRTGMSGVRDYKLRVLKDPQWNDAPIAEQLHVSCEHKFNEFVGPMWLGDFVILVAAVLADYHQVDDEAVEIWEAKIPELDWLTSSQVEGFFARKREMEELLVEELALRAMVRADREAVKATEEEVRKEQEDRQMEDEDYRHMLDFLQIRRETRDQNEHRLAWDMKSRRQELQEAPIPHTWEMALSQRTFDPDEYVDLSQRTFDPNEGDDED